VLSTLATSETVLEPEEKEQGVLLIDIGAGITDMSLYKGKRLLFCDSIPIGGEHLTNDIVIGLKISYNEAERIKKEFGLAKHELVTEDHVINISAFSEIAPQSVKRSDLVEIIEAWLSEIFNLINENVITNGLRDYIGSGIVLTGQGITEIKGCVELAQEIIGFSVTARQPSLTGILSPIYSTALGMIKYIADIKHCKTIASTVSFLKQPKQKKDKNNINISKKLRELNIWGKIKDFLEDTFN
jgi:cell division protein FtsA